LGTTTQNVAALARGYPYTIQLQVRPEVDGDISPFPAGCTLIADVAVYAGGTAVATLSTDDGTIARIGDDTIELRIPASATERLTNTTAQIDLVRSDTSPDQWLGLQLSLPVVQPITAAREQS
jgi:hypothetical protein